MSRLVVPLGLLVLLPVALWGQPKAQPVVAEGSSVTFRIKNAGIWVDGSFGSFRGTVAFDPADLGHCQLEAEADASSLETGIGARDRHLKEADYFDVANYPKLRFRATAFAQVAGAYQVTGELTLKATTKTVTLPVTARQVGGRWVLTTTFRLNRRDYGVGGSSWVLSDTVEVTATLSAGP
ncbi:MAG: YceI family protein [Bacteroidia bacterium]|nr:YceI family protein [Bacteroidia bacterium]